MQVKITKRVIDSLELAEKLYDVFDTEIRGFSLRVYPSGRMSFYYSYRNRAKKRKRIMIGVYGSTMTIQNARDKAQKFASQVAEGRDVQEEKVASREQAVELSKRTLSVFLDERYESWAVANQKRGLETVTCIRRGFPEFLKLPLNEISNAAVEKWRTKKIASGLKSNTINRKVNALKGALSRAVEWDIINDHPFKKVKDLKVDKRPNVRYLSPEEGKRLMAALKERDEDLKQARERGNAHRKQRHYVLLPSLLDNEFGDRMTPLVILSIKTGMRRGETFSLLWKHLDLDKGIVTVIGDNTKSSHTRHIPLSPLALESMKAWRDQQAKKDVQPGKLVFPSDDGGQLDNVKKSWATILKLAKITSFRWHDMRHDFASQLVMNGIPLNTVRELCGHASMDTTLRYAHLAPDHKVDAVASLG